MDRQKCFDRFNLDITVNLQLHAGADPGFTGARSRLYSCLQPRFKLAGACSPVRPHSNGGLQGCAHTVDDCLFLMDVWARRQARLVQDSTHSTYLDDSSIRLATEQDLANPIALDEHFDAFSGQKISAGKTKLLASTSRLADNIAGCTMYNHPLSVVDSARLVGAAITTSNWPTCGVIHDRMGTASGLDRIAMLPGTILHKAGVIDCKVGPELTVGLDTQSPTRADQALYQSKLKLALCREKTRAWICTPLLFTLVVKGHRMQVRALQQWHSLRSAAINLRREPALLEHWAALLASSRPGGAEDAGIGPIYLATLKALGWTLTSPTTVRTSHGLILNLITTPLLELGHWMRMYQRLSQWRTVSKRRIDLGGIADHEAGIDTFATTSLLRYGKGPDTDAIGKYVLTTMLCGGLHTQHRLAASGLSADASPLCRF